MLKTQNFGLLKLLCLSFLVLFSSQICNSEDIEDTENDPESNENWVMVKNFDNDEKRNTTNELIKIPLLSKEHLIDEESEGKNRINFSRKDIFPNSPDSLANNKRDKDYHYILEFDENLKGRDLAKDILKKNQTNSTSDFKNDLESALDISPGALLFILFGVLLTSQAVLQHWKKHHYRSFSQVTLFLLWVFPMILVLFLPIWKEYWKFISIWILFSFATIYHLIIARKHPLPRDVPRIIYYYFDRLYKLCNNAALVGYIILFASIFFPLHELQIGFSIPRCGILLIFYGMYFGVLTRDCAEMCADRMASVLGYAPKNLLPSRNLDLNTCGICGQKLIASFRRYDDDDDNSKELIFKLECSHQFHELCIRGWTMIGKKDICPYCSEKVDIKALFTNYWEKQTILWSQILDIVRYLIVWNPIILIVIQTLLWIFFHKKETESS